MQTLSRGELAWGQSNEFSEPLSKLSKGETLNDPSLPVYIWNDINFRIKANASAFIVLKSWRLLPDNIVNKTDAFEEQSTMNKLMRILEVETFIASHWKAIDMWSMSTTFKSNCKLETTTWKFSYFSSFEYIKRSVF